jgi:hypothetical protein
MCEYVGHRYSILQVDFSRPGTPMTRSALGYDRSATAKILELSHAISRNLTRSHTNLFSRDVRFFHKSVESEAGAGCEPGGEGLRHGRGDRWREECGMRWRSGGKGGICECVGLIPVTPFP